MCVICIKKKGVNLPSDEIIKKMWNTNSDGAGVMYPDNGKVHIEKGFFNVEKFIERVHELDESNTIIMHFRIATHGGVNAGMTHPFPLTCKENEIVATDILTDVGIAHNGIIPKTTIDPRPQFSDTAEYIMKKLYPRYLQSDNFFTKNKNKEKIQKDITSRMVFLTPDGEVNTVGEWEEEDGLLYSNTYFKFTYNNYYDRWGSYYDDFDYEEYYNRKYSGYKNYKKEHKSFDDWYYDNLLYFEIVYFAYHEEQSDLAEGVTLGEAIGNFLMAHPDLCYDDIISTALFE